MDNIMLEETIRLANIREWIRRGDYWSHMHELCHVYKEYELANSSLKQMIYCYTEAENIKAV